MSNIPERKYQTGSFRRSVVFVLICVLGYLCQVCIMPYVTIFGIMPNLLFVMVGIVTVAYGKLRAFWVGTIYGLLMEIMCPSVPILNLAVYALSALFCSFVFADKPLKTIEYERATNSERKTLAPWLRTLLCALTNTLIYEVIHVTYIYLSGSPLTVNSFLRAFADIVFTGLLAMILMFPIRRAIFGPKSRTKILQSAPVVFTRS